MWTYEQRTGRLTSPAGDVVATGYSGAGDGKNDPAAQAEHNVGPIPAGTYTIGPPKDTLTHGPFVLPLSPSADNEMFGRAGFLIHGDSVTEPGTASEGCVIMPRAVRELVAASDDKTLSVVGDIAD